MRQGNLRRESSSTPDWIGATSLSFVMINILYIIEVEPRTSSISTQTYMLMLSGYF